MFVFLFGLMIGSISVESLHFESCKADLSQSGCSFEKKLADYNQSHKRVMRPDLGY